MFARTSPWLATLVLLSLILPSPPLAAATKSKTAKSASSREKSSPKSPAKKPTASATHAAKPSTKEAPRKPPSSKAAGGKATKKPTLTTAQKKARAKALAKKGGKSSHTAARGKSRHKKARRAPQPPLPVPMTAGNHAVGRPSYGALYGALTLPFEGDYLAFLPGHRKRNRNHGTPTLAAALESGARAVHAAAPGVKTYLGDLSALHGGKISGHKSHQNGLDADVALYYRDVATGEPAVLGFVSLNADGYTADGRYRFDADLSWRFVEGLLRAEGARIQYVFLYAPLIAQVIEAGKRAGASPELLRRADAVLGQPGDSSPHDDHFHLRVYCPLDDPEKLCQTSGVRWPWAFSEKPLPLEESAPLDLSLAEDEPREADPEDEEESDEEAAADELDAEPSPGDEAAEEEEPASDDHLYHDGGEGDRGDDE